MRMCITGTLDRGRLVTKLTNISFGNHSSPNKAFPANFQKGIGERKNTHRQKGYLGMYVYISTTTPGER